MKVLFLDVDGVLVHQGTVGNGKVIGEPWGSSFYFAATVDPACALRVKRIIDTTGAKIVVSSVWRSHTAQMTGLHKALSLAGFDRRELRKVIVGSTPVLRQERPAEIAAWLAEHPEVEKYVVLDDGYIAGHPQVDPIPNYATGGLQDATVDAIIARLGSILPP